MAMFLFAAIFIVLFALGTPIAVALGATSLFNIEVFETVSLSSFTKTASNGFSSYVLVACPLFTFAGDIMAKGGISALTHALAVSFAGKVRVNSISPGWINTDDTVYEGEVF